MYVCEGSGCVCYACVCTVEHTKVCAFMRIICIEIQVDQVYDAYVNVAEIIALFLQGATLPLPLTVGNDNHDDDDDECDDDGDDDGDDEDDDDDNRSQKNCQHQRTWSTTTQSAARIL